MINEADAAQVRAAAQSYREVLLSVGPLKRLSKRQQSTLNAAHEIFFDLVLKLTGPHRLHESMSDWALLTAVLAKHDPIWHTRGSTGVAAAIASITHLVRPK